MIEAIPRKRTPEDLKQIAIDLYAGKIFTDKHLTNPEDAAMVFMPIALMTNKQRKQIIRKKPAMIFEYLNKAGPIMVNGMPVFFSFHILSQKEAETVNKMYKEIKEAVDKVGECKEVKIKAEAPKKKRKKKNAKV